LAFWSLKLGKHKKLGKPIRLALGPEIDDRKKIGKINLKKKLGKNWFLLVFTGFEWV